MPKRTQYYDLAPAQQYAINEFELLQVYRILVSKMKHRATHQFLLESLSPASYFYSLDMDNFLLDNYRLPTKKEKLAYLYLKGVGINKISAAAGLNQPTITSFIESPNFKHFKPKLLSMWQTVPNIQQHHNELVSNFVIIKPNICGGFHI